VCYVNPAFCRLTVKTSDELVGTSFCATLPETDECAALLDRVYRTGQPETHTKLSASESDPALSRYAMWPVMANQNAVGVAVQVVETAPVCNMSSRTVNTSAICS
jgi:PAS domain-containing protein